MATLPLLTHTLKAQGHMIDSVDFSVYMSVAV